MTKLDIAKKIIKAFFYFGRCGIYNCRGRNLDTFITLYDENSLTINLYFYWSYFEVFGLLPEEFAELKKYYEELKKEFYKQ